jgi:NAD(P)-dependent dehydrogenase (short-subunit alcohol dehydrogenase family)
MPEPVDAPNMTGREMKLNEYEGKLVVVTGDGGGVGSALVALFSERGAAVTGCDRTAELLDALPLAARRSFDLADGAAADAAALALIEVDGAPDVLINNAGWTRAETLADLTGEATAREIDLNLVGVMRFSEPVARAMAARGSGSIVFVSSVNALLHFGNPAYAAAKAGINAYARALAVEYGRNGVRANVVCPGSIRTPAWEHRLAKDPGIMAKLKRLYPLGRIVDTSEVAEAVAFLASERAAGITGAVLPVDAGLTAGCLPFIDSVLGEQNGE